ncbi:MAG TPA: DNA polymerase III subunit gamma/tau [Gammaproteobacteria bacterium]|jgi:DNA polymerase-3 subunit gamma/tau|nr:DNA polymerase III subunit gamma/tau [Gammaproteobacteria bacterium]
MSYQVLARKWRPQSFKDMVGQEAILRMLANALEQKRIHHAYLFTGTRGVGKTTLARILAKCLNCEKDVTSTPCGTCHICKAVDAGQFLDLYEIDAASRTKVEDTRELLDNVLYPPTQGRYKIYLIDEVHMLSNHSFNALLKTLEEPPEHVKFLLATTDPKKLPITILSRCLQFHLKRILPEQITGHLQHICETEKISFELPALERLAHGADGSMRDALSLLDQAIAYGHGAVNFNDVKNMLGSMAQDDVMPLATALASQDGAQLFAAIEQLAERAPDFQQVLEELISLFHKVAITQIIPDAVKANDTAAALAKQLTPAEVQLYYQIALLGRRDLALSAAQQQGFEMTMLRMLAFKPGCTDIVQAPAAVKATPKTQAAEKPVAAAQQPVSGMADWNNILPALGLSGMAYALASNCAMDSMADNKIKLFLTASHEPMLNAKLKDRIAEALGKHFGCEIQLDIAVSAADLATPAKQQQVQQSKKLDAATQSILQDPKVKQLIDMYDATVEVSLV